MEDNDRTQLRSLLAEQRVATLALIVAESPFASLVPFAMTEGYGSALIHASSLARHSAGLSSGAPFSLLIHESDDQPDTNPAQLARVTVSGSVVPLARDGEQYPGAKARYLEKFPKSEITFQLGDFTLYQLQVESCRFVAGFGKAFDVAPAELQDLT